LIVELSLRAGKLLLQIWALLARILLGLFFRRMLVFSGGCGRGEARIQRFGVMVVSLCWNGDGGWIVVMVAGVILVPLLAGRFFAAAHGEMV
jgi:hypothetical protein